MPARLTQDQWIAQAKQIWGERYDYSQVEYAGAHKHVTVICPMHGPWSVMPTNHVNSVKPCGCPRCGKQQSGQTRRYTWERFLQAAFEVHGNHYRYCKADVTGAQSKVEIRCPQHGPFLQTVEVHLRGCGCPQCGKQRYASRRKHWSAAMVASKVRQMSRGYVDLLMDSFRGHNYSARFICAKHGEYERSVNSALHSSHPCLRCSEELSMLGPEQA